jgi:hypothetical protein
MNKVVKILVEKFGKKSCPNCCTNLKIKQKVNYTHGTGSKGIKSYWWECPRCNYKEIIKEKK